MSTPEIPVIEELDIEAHSKSGSKDPAPLAKVYLVKIDKGTFRTPESVLTGRALLELAGRTPVENFKLTEKLHGGAAKTIGLTDSVDLRAPGVERFMTMKRDQTEG